MPTLFLAGEPAATVTHRNAVDWDAARFITPMLGHELVSEDIAIVEIGEQET